MKNTLLAGLALTSGATIFTSDLYKQTNPYIAQFQAVQSQQQKQQQQYADLHAQNSIRAAQTGGGIATASPHASAQVKNAVHLANIRNKR